MHSDGHKRPTPLRWRWNAAAIAFKRHSRHHIPNTGAGLQSTVQRDLLEISINRLASVPQNAQPYCIPKHLSETSHPCALPLGHQAPARQQVQAQRGSTIAQRQRGAANRHAAAACMCVGRQQSYNRAGSCSGLLNMLVLVKPPTWFGCAYRQTNAAGAAKTLVLLGTRACTHIKHTHTKAFAAQTCTHTESPKGKADFAATTPTRQLTSGWRPISALRRPKPFGPRVRRRHRRRDSRRLRRGSRPRRHRGAIGREERRAGR